jgi:signal transduction histidine kinase
VRYPESLSRDGGPRLLGVLTDLTLDRFRDAQLREAQKLDAVGQLAGGVAHDLNNILTAMMAGVHLAIQHGDLDARTERRLTQVRDECHRAATVIRELLAFGRKQLVTPAICRPADIVRECQPMLARLIGEDIELDLDLGGTHGMFVDRAQMIQVIVSLAVHARDSMPTGGRLSISTADGVNDVLITVADTGMGVTAETRARLFEPYFTTRKLGWGTGLGLSVVHGIVSQFGGQIEVESAPGKGTTFVMRFAAHAAPQRAGAGSAPTPQELHGRETILLVEDERVLRNQLAESLRDLGYTILEARNGYDALSVLEAHGAPVHLILSDVIMPEMNGATIVAQLREWYANLRVVFITGIS